MKRRHTIQAKTKQKNYFDDNNNKAALIMYYTFLKRSTRKPPITVFDTTHKHTHQQEIQQTMQSHS